jgi:hypothetical protein
MATEQLEQAGTGVAPETNKKVKTPKAEKAAKEPKLLVVKVKAQYLKEFEKAGMAAHHHLMPIGDGRAVMFVWDTREAIDVVDIKDFGADAFVKNVKDSGAPLVVTSNTSKAAESILATSSQKA